MGDIPVDYIEIPTDFIQFDDDLVTVKISLCDENLVKKRRRCHVQGA